MKNEEELDHLLEESIHAVENGQAAQNVAAGLPEDALQLASLVRLADAIRGTAHPVLSAEAQGTAKKRMLALANQTAPQNAPRPAFRWAWAFGLSGAATVFFCFFIFLVAGGLWWYGPMASHSATVADVSGTVEIASPGGTDWHSAAAGELIQTGERIRTGADGSITLAFFEGSRTTLGPGTEISLTLVGGGWGDVLQVALSQQSGSARYNIVPLRGDTGQFVVDTPGGSASVHGTVFAVTVDPVGQTLFSVDRGKVVVESEDEQVAVTAGQATRSSADLAPQPSTFRFALSDTLTAINGSTWNMSGILFNVTDETSITGNPQVGQTIFVKGRILNKDQWVADVITAGGETETELQLTGTVQAIEAGSWNIDGATILTDEATVVGEGINIGDPVLVVYTLLDDGQWLALKIIKLDDENDNAQILCTGADPQPKGQTLAAQYGVPYVEIMGWFCQGFGFGEIDLAYGLSLESGVPVMDIFALRQQGLGWGEIKRSLSVTPTPTAASTPSTDLTVTPTLTLTTTPSGTETRDCTGADPHPKGQSLADQYGVPYDEIMGWFCQGFGFGEIDQAYGLSIQSGTPVSEIFALRQSGMGWGEIKKMFDEDKDKGKGKPTKKP